MFIKCSNKSWLRCSNFNNICLIVSILERFTISHKLWLETHIVTPCPSSKALPIPHTPHNIIAWPECFSWKYVFFCISHLKQLYFSLILCWKHLFCLVGAIAKKTTAVSCAYYLGKQRGSVFESDDEGKDSHPDHSIRALWELPMFHNCEELLGEI